ncbi:PASTA domain-containing protein [Deinococcus psychrotolerans]|uniref:PASTA domain-containing protein n=1 Tax=Deinococcus psychrotolerans TaxID=2489213 RepID=A0A3G8YA35_9DEIO|nr:PASTA domain-containing protein [Deinococcus psychrotolerans]AZI41773.1 PASTA domain-containing protein [Deinococcus psychrotolerans]
MARIDGKYEVIEQRSQSGGQTIYTVQADPLAGAEAGELLRLAWFEVTTSDERNAFHKYRTALKALAPAGLADVVARPGAYYAVWREVPGVALAAFQAQPIKNETALSNLRDLAARLAVQGFALMDAEIVMDGDVPRLAFMTPASRTPAEAESLSAAALTPISQGKVRRVRPRGSVWSWIPGVACVIGAAYFGAQAAQIYLNPALADVPAVTGQEAKAAADKLSALGYRVQYAEGDQRGAALGAVIAQEPAPGTTLHLGRLVTLTVNNPPTLTVPRFEEKTIDQVKATLAEDFLKLGSVSQVDGGLSQTPKGRVVAQLPAPGAVIRRGQSVRLLISSGVAVQQTWLPNLRGLPFDDARDLVRRAGLVVNLTKKETSDSVENTVLRQSPAAFDKVDIGSPVTLVVAQTRYEAPAVATPPLPVPPLPLPPPSPEPVTNPTFNTGGADNSGTVPNTPAAQPEFAPVSPAAPTPAAPTPETAPSQPTPTAPQTPNSGQPSTEQPGTQQPNAQPPATASRIVPLSYTFPATLPAGQVEIVVRDEDGERAVLPPTDSAQLAGALAQRDDVSVRGNYVFTVRIDGKDYATFGP